MAKRTPSSRSPAGGRRAAKSRAATPQPAAATPEPAAANRRRPHAPADDGLPSLAELKRARAQLDVAIAALERRRRGR